MFRTVDTEWWLLGHTFQNTHLLFSIKWYEGQTVDVALTSTYEHIVPTTKKAEKEE